MSNASIAIVQNAIVHSTDRNMPAPVYSEVELNLPANPRVHEYFNAQVQNAIVDNASGAAIFAVSGSQDAKAAAARILANQANFITASQDLATLLHRAMRSHPRITPGSLAVCVYTSGNDPARSLALIKLDPASALVQAIVTAKGKRLVSFDIQENVMPTARERLQKAALIVPPGKQRYELLLLDRQTPEVAAAWWAETFLNTAPVFDGKSGATGLKDGVVSAHRKLLKEGAITAAEGETIQQHTHVALQTKRVNRRKFLEDLAVPDAVKVVIDAEIEKRLPGLITIPINPTYASEKIARKTRYQGDYGIVIEYETAHEKEVVFDKSTYKRGDDVEVTRLVIDVPRLQWIK
jgi:hypothetical protein